MIINASLVSKTINWSTPPKFQTHMSLEYEKVHPRRRPVNCSTGERSVPPRIARPIPTPRNSIPSLIDVTIFSHLQNEQYQKLHH